MGRRTWILLGVLVAAVVAAGVTLVCLNASSPDGKVATPATTQPSAESSIQLPEPIVSPPSGVGGLVGRYWSVDDTGFPDFPVSGGSFLVVPGATVAELWPQEDLGDRAPYFATLRVEYDFDQLAEQYGATIVEVQPDSQFRVISPPGPTVICKAGSNWTSGCTELDLPESGTLQAFRIEEKFVISVE